MDILRDIIQQVILIIIVGLILDMLLPNGRMQSLIRLVVGIFIMVAVLNPVMSWVTRSDWAQTLGRGLPEEELAVNGTSYDDIRRQGERLREQSLSQAKEEAKVRLERQVEALAGLKAGVHKATAQVEWEAKAGEKAGIGQITVTLQTDGGGGNADEAVAPVMVDPVKIDKAEQNGTATGEPVPHDSKRQETAQEIARTLSGLYGVPAERVRVQWE
ncbi:stage III sporulation protein AF [Heliobacterium chlorum]|uniref:Stage III sporulation protein AF n=1 Tax=Heliobacterium chlorum TaxID=2698 RepID=A0ABR7T2P6_HELCL|nr:stage III sporulation protein AF [Heliobacterium chlorum]